MMKISAILLAALCCTLGTTAFADPVVYTVQTVIDGTLGSKGLNEALVQFRFEGDTADVHNETTNGVTISSIQKGSASIRVFEGDHWSTAWFVPGEVYVRYDITHGVVGFGSSKVSPVYPFALDCGNANCSIGTVQADHGPGVSTTCCFFEDGISAMLNDIAELPSDAAYVSLAVPKLHETLAQSTLLSGYVQSCAAPYVVTSIIYACTAGAAVPLITDQGDFYVQDMSGASNVASFLVRVGKSSGDDESDD
jgi:hypothetical protein